jgi:hypothetical protein
MTALTLSVNYSTNIYCFKNQETDEYLDLQKSTDLQFWILQRKSILSVPNKKKTLTIIQL